MTLLCFEPVEGPDDEEPEGYDENCCNCPKDAPNRYHLSIEEGQASLVHAPCGKVPPASWGDDWQEWVQMDVIPVSVEWKTDCDGQRWHGLDPCECGYWVQVTPGPPEAPKDLTEAERNLAEARRAVHESLVPLPAWEADRVRALIADLETAVEAKTAIQLAATPETPSMQLARQSVQAMINKIHIQERRP